MEYTKYILRKFWVIAVGLATLVSAVVIPLANSDEGGMISNYCVQGRPFMELHLQEYELCGVWVTLGFVVLFIAGLMIIGFIGAAIADSIKWGLPRVRKGLIRFINRTRPANLLLVPCVVNDEIYVAVKNEELFLGARNVYGYTEFAWNYDPYKGRIPWKDSSTVNGELYIPRKEYRTLHFATIDKSNNTLVLHRIEGDIIFPLPSQEHRGYKFPLTISGSMFFFRWRYKKVDLRMGRLIIVESSETEIRVKVWDE